VSKAESGICSFHLTTLMHFKPNKIVLYRCHFACICGSIIHRSAIVIATLQGILESRKAFNRLASSRSPLIGAVELERHGQRDNDHESTSNHRGVDTWVVGGLVLVSKDGAANDATDATSADKSSGAESTLPLSTDVIRLVCENAGDIGVASDHGQEDAEIADPVTLCEAKEREA
jgi:hypothetical protein